MTFLMKADIAAGLRRDEFFPVFQPQVELRTGQPREQAMGNGWLAMLHQDDLDPTREAIRHTLATGEPIDIRYRVRRPGQEWKWMRSRGSPQPARDARAE